MTIPKSNIFGQNGRHVQDAPIQACTDTHALGGNTNTAVTVSVSGVPGQCVRLSQAFWSFSGAPTAGKLTIQDTNGVFFEQFVGVQGAFEFKPPRVAQIASALTAVLAAAGGVTGELDLSAFYVV